MPSHRPPPFSLQISTKLLNPKLDHVATLGLYKIAAYGKIHCVQVICRLQPEQEEICKLLGIRVEQFFLPKF